MMGSTVSLKNHKPSAKLNSNERPKNTNVNIDEHLLPIEQVVTRYNSNLTKGLTEQQAQQLINANGFNQLTPQKQSSHLLKFFKQLMGGFSSLLWLGAILCVVAYFIEYLKTHNADKDNLYLGIALIIVVVITGAFAYYQESKSSAIMESFKDLIPRNAFVIRDGILKEINPKRLVVGDIVEINGGDQVPADIRIFESLGCKVDNSSITGESDPQSRSCTNSYQNPLEAENLAFFSTYCTEGRARGIVIRTSDYTVIGQIANLTQQQNNQTTIAREISHFIKMITIFAFSLGSLFFILSLSIGYSWLQAVVFFIGIIVANVPEGLLATVTVCLSLTANSMYKKNCLVKNLEAVETLGSTSIICSDKTGTLTQNKMKVSHVWFNNDIIDVIGQNDQNRKKFLLKIYSDKKNRFEDFLRVCTLCNKARFKANFENVDITKRECSGDASEVALFKLLETIGVDCLKIRNRFPIVSEVPFNSTNKFHLTVHSLIEKEVTHKYLACLKGAPERVLNVCHSVLLDGHCRILDANTRKVLDNICTYFASRGERVLAFAELYTNDIQALFEDESRSKANLQNVPNFTLLGLMSLVDPPRPEVPDAVEKCRLAGIKVFMVTGDHPITAQAIAQAVGIISVPREYTIVMNEQIYNEWFCKNNLDKNSWSKAIVVPGDILSKLSVDQLDYIVGNFAEIVFARTSPHQKLDIVKSCQRLEHIVAVTGDGVNDSPALKRADIGISMGVTGSDVSKEAADMILLDDNFATIVVGIEEGRVIFDNLKKSIAYVLASNFSEVMPFIFYVIFGFPLALGTITILCIDLGTDIFPSISLAYEKAENDIMKQKPRNPNKDHLVTLRLFNRAYFQIGMIQVSAAFFTYFVVMADHGFYLSDLFNIRKIWDSDSYVIIDRSNKTWSFKERKILEHRCQTAYFVSIVVCQWADLIICKTRRNSIIQQGMSNKVLNTSLLVETLMALFLCYCPGMFNFLKLYPLKWWYWFMPLPFAIFIIVYDEIRRLILRTRPGGFYEQETYF